MLKPSLFGKYVLLERVSVGGMAEVHRVRPLNAPNFKRFLALKRILPNLAEDEEFIAMFVDEAKIAVQLHHRQVCQIYELGQLNDSFYIVMEYIAGKNLLQMMQRFRAQKKIMSVTQAAFIVQRVCEGLDYAHRKLGEDGSPLNIIHRDISPQNILVSYDGEVKVIDFGIARAASKNKQTQVGVLKGKFGYMSPEQANGEDVDRRSDIFAVGALLWEMLTARRLFQGDSDFATLEKVRSETIQPPSARNKRVPPELDRIVARALDRDRTTRYQWAGEMADELRAFLATVTPPYTDRTLSGWMVANWEEDLEEERQKIEAFKQFVSAQDVIRYNEALYETAADELLEDELEELEDATRVFQMDDPDAQMPVARGEKLLAASADQRLLDVVRSGNEVLLPRGSDQVPEFERTAPPPRISQRPTHLSMSGPVIAVRKKSNAGLYVLLLLLVAAIGVGGAFAYPWYVEQQRLAALVTVTVQTQPSDGVEVTLNGQRYTGAQPLRIPEVTAGRVYIEVRREGYETVLEPMDLVAGTTVQFTRTLVPESTDGTVTLRLSAPDAQAQVYLDGQLVGGQGATRTFTALAGTPHTVEVFRAGHYVEAYSFTLDGGGTFEREVALRPVLGTLTVNSQPAGEVVVDGEVRGTTESPLVLADLNITKPYLVEIRPLTRGFQPYSQQLVLVPPYDRVVLARLSRLGDAPPVDAGITYGHVTVSGGRGWQRVFVNGIDSGRVTPIDAELPLLLPAGDHELTFVRAGVERNVRVTVLADGDLPVTVPTGE